MSKKFDMVKNFYEKGLWSLARVRNAVEKHWITEDEFTAITGEEF